jgi:hypothetical protein
MNKIDFPDVDLSIQIFHGERLFDDEYEITPPDFSLLSDLDYQKIGKVYDQRTCKRFQVSEPRIRGSRCSFCIDPI